MGAPVGLRSTQPNPNHNELVFAYRLLLYMHANANNTYLLLAVVAWIRSESGSKWIGWNPLNLRPGQDDSKWRSGMRKAGNNGYFSVYKSLEAGARATANRLVKLGYYKDMIAAARGDRSKQKGGDAQQAMDFLLALVVSKWDAGHYGLKGAELKDPKSLYKTTLYSVWNDLLATKGWKMPADTIYQTPTPKPPPAPDQPRSGLHAVVRREYILPYAAETFYEARIHPQDYNPDDPRSTGL